MVKRRVRFVMPVMVEVDGDSDEVLRVVTLPNEIRRDRDDLGHFLVYDESFLRRHRDMQPQTHAAAVAEPYWEYPRFPVGSPVNWPDSLTWEEGFLTEADDGYGEIHPYGEPEY
ncbi:MAG: hypothetical protein GY926_16855 [bacterium]|nr:hypothetical protein [bacterium]MCP4966885.1 hypothetical protein [bacterium]